MNRRLLSWAMLAMLALVTAAYAAGSTTLTGSVVSTSADQLVIRVADGEKTFVVNEMTLKPADLMIGAQVNVTFHDENGQLMATQVAAADPSSAATASASSPEPSAPASATATATAYAPPADDPVAPVADTPPASEASASVESAATAETDELPATGSKLPLLALLGLGAGAGALVLRRIH